MIARCGLSLFDGIMLKVAMLSLGSVRGMAEKELSAGGGSKKNNASYDDVYLVHEYGYKYDEHEYTYDESVYEFRECSSTAVPLSCSAKKRVLCHRLFPSLQVDAGLPSACRWYGVTELRGTTRTEPACRKLRELQVRSATPRENIVNFPHEQQQL